MLESSPSCRVTSGEIIDVDNDIPVFDTIKEEDVITSVLNKLRKKNTQQDEDSDKDQEQNENIVDPCKKW
jgi:hypothetical protein